MFWPASSGAGASTNTPPSEAEWERTDQLGEALLGNLRGPLEKLRGQGNGVQDELFALDPGRVALVRSPNHFHHRDLSAHRSYRGLVQVAGRLVNGRQPFHSADLHGPA